MKPKWVQKERYPEDNGFIKSHLLMNGERIATVIFSPYGKFWYWRSIADDWTDKPLEWTRGRAKRLAEESVKHLINHSGD